MHGRLDCECYKLFTLERVSECLMFIVVVYIRHLLLNNSETFLHALTPV